MYRQELEFLYSACHLMMLYISMKFHENILNGFVFCTSSDKFYMFMKFHETLLNGFQVIERLQNCNC